MRKKEFPADVLEANLAANDSIDSLLEMKDMIKMHEITEPVVAPTVVAPVKRVYRKKKATSTKSQTDSHPEVSESIPEVQFS